MQFGFNAGKVSPCYFYHQTRGVCGWYTRRLLTLAMHESWNRRKSELETTDADGDLPTSSVK